MSGTEDRLKELMLASLDGDAVAYRKMLGELSDHLKRYFRRRLHDSLSGQLDDLVQETLIAVHAKRMTFDRERAVTAWVYAIARYKLVDHIRRSKYASHIPIDDVSDFLADERSQESTSDLTVMLDTLPERTKQLIHRVKVEGQSVAEAAAATGMSESAVKVAIHRGLKSLLHRFGGDHDR